jgi:hypothetical protein
MQDHFNARVTGQFIQPFFDTSKLADMPGAGPLTISLGKVIAVVSP